MEFFNEVEYSVHLQFWGSVFQLCARQRLVSVDNGVGWFLHCVQATGEGFQLYQLRWHPCLVRSVLPRWMHQGCGIRQCLLY